jgi:hypothetical protein
MGRLVALAIVVAGAVGAFAIYTFGGYRHTGSSDLGRAEKARVASILHATISGNSYYIADIKRTSPGRYLVTYGNVDHPSVRVCTLFHIDLARWRRIGTGVQGPCE